MKARWTRNRATDEVRGSGDPHHYGPKPKAAAGAPGPNGEGPGTRRWWPRRGKPTPWSQRGPRRPRPCRRVGSARTLMKHLDDVRAALKQQLEEVVEGLPSPGRDGPARPGRPGPRDGQRCCRTLRAQVDEVVRLSALADAQSDPVRIPCPFCQQLVMPQATACGFCWRSALLPQRLGSSERPGSPDRIRRDLPAAAVRHRHLHPRSGRRREGGRSAHGAAGGGGHRCGRRASTSIRARRSSTRFGRGPRATTCGPPSWSTTRTCAGSPCSTSTASSAATTAPTSSIFSTPCGSPRSSPCTPSSINRRSHSGRSRVKTAKAANLVVMSQVALELLARGATTLAARAST